MNIPDTDGMLTIWVYAPWDETPLDETECIRWSDIHTYVCKKDTDTLVVTHPYLQYGDYDNSCAVERSNVRVFAEEFASLIGVHWWRITGVHGSNGIALKYPITDEGILEMLAGLDDYPCIDEEDVCFVEEDLYTEAWESWARSDFESACLSEMESATGYDGDLEFESDDAVRELFEEWRDAANEYWIVESGGNAYIDVDRVMQEFNEEELRAVAKWTPYE